MDAHALEPSAADSAAVGMLLTLQGAAELAQALLQATQPSNRLAEQKPVAGRLSAQGGSTTTGGPDAAAVAAAAVSAAAAVAAAAGGVSDEDTAEDGQDMGSTGGEDADGDQRPKKKQRLQAQQRLPPQHQQQQAGPGGRGGLAGSKSGRACRNHTGYIGVRKRQWGMFAAEIRDGDKRRWLGSFSQASEAGMAYDAALILQKKHRAKTNFIYEDFPTMPRPGAEHGGKVRYNLVPKEVMELYKGQFREVGDGGRGGSRMEEERKARNFNAGLPAPVAAPVGAHTHSGSAGSMSPPRNAAAASAAAAAVAAASFGNAAGSSSPAVPISATAAAAVAAARLQHAHSINSAKGAVQLPLPHLVVPPAVGAGRRSARDFKQEGGEGGPGLPLSQPPLALQLPLQCQQQLAPHAHQQQQQLGNVPIVGHSVAAPAVKPTRQPPDMGMSNAMLQQPAGVPMACVPILPAGAPQHTPADVLQPGLHAVSPSSGSRGPRPGTRMRQVVGYFDLETVGPEAAAAPPGLLEGPPGGMMYVPAAHMGYAMGPLAYGMAMPGADGMHPPPPHMHPHAHHGGPHAAGSVAGEEVEGDEEEDEEEEEEVGDVGSPGYPMLRATYGMGPPGYPMLGMAPHPMLGMPFGAPLHPVHMSYAYPAGYPPQAMFAGPGMHGGEGAGSEEDEEEEEEGEEGRDASGAAGARMQGPPAAALYGWAPMPPGCAWGPIPHPMHVQGHVGMHGVHREQGLAAGASPRGRARMGGGRDMAQGAPHAGSWEGAGKGPGMQRRPHPAGSHSHGNNQSSSHKRGSEDSEQQTHLPGLGPAASTALPASGNGAVAQSQAAVAGPGLVTAASINTQQQQQQLDGARKAGAGAGAGKAQAMKTLDLAASAASEPAQEHVFDYDGSGAAPVAAMAPGAGPLGGAGMALYGATADMPQMAGQPFLADMDVGVVRYEGHAGAAYPHMAYGNPHAATYMYPQMGHHQGAWPSEMAYGGFLSSPRRAKAGHGSGAMSSHKMMPAAQ